MSKVAQTDTLIELHVPDFRIVKDFYGKLGFETVWETEPEKKGGYLVVKRENSILCFNSGNEAVYNHPYFKRFSKDTKRGYAVEIVIYIENIENFYNKVKEFANIVEDLKTMPWGSKDFRIEDPFGFYIRFSEPYDTLIP